MKDGKLEKKKERKQEYNRGNVIKGEKRKDEQKERKARVPLQRHGF